MCINYILSKLSKEGFGRYVDKEEMAKDKVLPQHNCFCAYVKTDSLLCMIRIVQKNCTQQIMTKELMIH